MLHEKAKSAGITILGEMGVDPGIGMTSQNIASYNREGDHYNETLQIT